MQVLRGTRIKIPEIAPLYAAIYASEVVCCSWGHRASTLPASSARAVLVYRRRGIFYRIPLVSIWQYFIVIVVIPSPAAFCVYNTTSHSYYSITGTSTIVQSTFKYCRTPAHTSSILATVWDILQVHACVLQTICTSIISWVICV